jgi:serine/threonine protein kinase
VVFYELLTRRRPFRGNLKQVTRQVIHGKPKPPRRIDPGIPRSLQAICLKAMSKEPARRYPTALAMAQDCARALAGEPIEARSALFRWPWGLALRKSRAPRS